jgi:cell division transport system permease protein
MSTNSRMAEAPYDPEPAPAGRRLPIEPPRETPIVPRSSISGRALVAVVAIMTFLAALTTGAVMLVLGSAAEWQSDVAREMTIQIRPQPGHDLDAEVNEAAAIARGTPGIADVRPYTAAESARLLEPWLGTGLSIDALPVPRIIVLRVASDQRPDIAALRAALTAKIPGASVDDHRGWIDRMRAMANAAVGVGVGVLALVLAATVLSVTFATRGAMATNRPIVEVLHLIGARDAYIAGQFQRQFLILGLQGGLIGGGAALLMLALAGIFSNLFLGTAAQEETSALFSTFSIGIAGYAAVIGQIVLVAAVTAWTSRRVVSQTLATIE